VGGGGGVLVGVFGGGGGVGVFGVWGVSKYKPSKKARSLLKS